MSNVFSRALQSNRCNMEAVFPYSTNACTQFNVIMQFEVGRYGRLHACAKEVLGGVLFGGKSLYDAFAPPTNVPPPISPPGSKGGF
jgi:hypothetical protein